MILAGLLAGIVLAQWEAKRLGENPDHVLNIAVLGVVFGLIGARLYHVIDLWSCDPLVPNDFCYSENPGQIFVLRAGGIGIFGAIAGSAFALVLYVWWVNRRARAGREQRIRALRWFDIGAPAFLLGQGVGRWGQLLQQGALRSGDEPSLGHPRGTAAPLPLGLRCGSILPPALPLRVAAEPPRRHRPALGWDAASCTASGRETCSSFTSSGTHWSAPRWSSSVAATGRWVMSPLHTSSPAAMIVIAPLALFLWRRPPYLASGKRGHPASRQHPRCPGGGPVTRSRAARSPTYAGLGHRIVVLRERVALTLRCLVAA